MSSRVDVVRLTRNGIWAHRIAPDPGYTWPAAATTHTEFRDTTGALLADITGTVTPNEITYLAQPADVNNIPAGASFETFLGTADGPLKIRHGKVIRPEAMFFDAPAAVLAASPLLFTDTFSTLGLKSSWEVVAGQPKVFDNTSLPNGVGATQVLLGEAKAAIRWFQPLNGDTARVKVNLLNQHSSFLLFDFARLTVIIAANQNFTSGLGVQFEMAEAGNFIHLATVDGPTAFTYRGAAIANSVVDNDDYTIYYDNSTDTISVYKGTGTTPLGSWQDAASLMPHGPGYRYAGLSFHNSQLTDGLQCSFWSAKDDV